MLKKKNTKYLAMQVVCIVFLMEEPENTTSFHSFQHRRKSFRLYIRKTIRKQASAQKQTKRTKFNANILFNLLSESKVDSHSLTMTLISIQLLS